MINDTMSNSNILDGLGNTNNYENDVLNNQVMKTLIVEILGSVKTIENRMKTIEENQSRLVWKIEAGQVEFRSGQVESRSVKDAKFENDFRDATPAVDEIEEQDFRQKVKKDFIDSMDKNKEETWAKKLFKNEDSPKKVKIEVQGSVKT